MQDYNFDVSIKAHLEANKDYADQLFQLALDHRMTYMALNEKAFEMYKPVFDWFEKKRIV